MNPTIKRSAVALLANDIAELLRSEGPITTQDLRNRLGVASVERFQAAVLTLTADRTAEAILQGSSDFPVLRLVGDQRPLPKAKPKPGNRISNALRELARTITERPQQVAR